MKKRLGLYVIVVTMLTMGLIMVVVLGIVLTVPTSRYVLIGFINNESFDEGRPLSYWIHALQDKEADKRKQAAFALGRMGPQGEKAVPALAVALKDESEVVRLNASLSLMKIGAEARSAVPELAEALEDEVDWVRMNAALALSRMGPDAKPVVRALIKAMQDEKNRQPLFLFGRSVRQSAVMALGKIGPDAQAAVPAISAALQQEEDADFREDAARALALISPEAAKAGVP
jgi:HEAT repeat protein